MPDQPVPWRAAWERALYGADGFFRRSRPGDHFRTSAHVALFADAVAELARSTSAATVVDVGAGGGELLAALVDLLPGVELVGVEIAGRPSGLPAEIAWRHDLPDDVDGLLIANEWLDNIPCAIVEVDETGTVREVLVDPGTGAETLGAAYESAWLRT